ncbi:DUF6314 family protein [Halomonas sp. YLGW01]|uniref:DUF6314 family protein n=1 Tax=Halomonas sp. YLGW01 TaxID=2773308 RepID=UPI001785DB4A|nr:DUF6314 family protein [Halomonas sp. YLGW01]
MTSIIRVRALLPSICRLKFSPRSGAASQCDWSGEGHGRVTVSEEGNVLRFHEEGHFALAGQPHEVAFRNVYRWELEGDRLRLFHERRGREAAVWLFDLIEADDGSGLVAAEPHLCGADRYTARLAIIEDGFSLDWTIQGPRKDEAIAYRYFVR